MSSTSRVSPRLRILFEKILRADLDPVINEAVSSALVTGVFDHGCDKQLHQLQSSLDYTLKHSETTYYACVLLRVLAFYKQPYRSKYFTGKLRCLGDTLDALLNEKSS